MLFPRVSLVSLALLLATGASAANNSEQVVFSGLVADTTSGPVGFWIWCEADSNNPYAGECNGAMYFYGLHITKHVIDAAPPSEGAEGVYTLSVTSTDGQVSCTLSNTTAPVHGPHNTVMLSCTSPAVLQGSTNNAVINVTGP
jgi:hypothetical protein